MSSVGKTRKLIGASANCFCSTFTLKCARVNSTIAQFGRLKRQVYPKRYPLRIVNPDGSSFDVMYKEPRAIFHLPYDTSEMSPEHVAKYMLERKTRMSKKSKTVVQTITEESIDFDHSFLLLISSVGDLIHLGDHVTGNSVDVRMAAFYGFEQKGSLYSDSYRIFLTYNGKVISPFHDIPLYPDPSNDSVLNMVVEVCRFTNAKMEINKELKLNPIKQDVKKGKPRFITNLFPNKGYPWNYGAFPQTWEDPRNVDQHTGYNGDNDPLDVCDISDIIPPAGNVIQVKILGILAMIDEGETDWKVIAINTADPKATEYVDIQDVERLKPGLLKRTVEWFKYYKVCDGKPANKFAFNEEFKDQQFAKEIVKHTHQSWKDLIGRQRDAAGISLVNTTIQLSSEKIPSDAAKEHVDQHGMVSAPAPLPENIDHFFFVPC